MEELYHHGVKGQKWGVRRYQNEDGTLTDKGRARFDKVGKSKIRTARDNSTAKWVYKEHSKYDDRQAKMYERQSKKAEKKGNHELSKQYADAAKMYIKHSNVMKKNLSDIKDGTIKAGRDFIINTDTQMRFGSYTVNYTVINKDKNKKNTSFGVRTYMV